MAARGPAGNSIVAGRREQFRLQLPTRKLLLGERTLLMGVLNVTPDSFSDGGKYFDVDAAVARGLEMEREGADIVDIGGESTRPGSEATPVEEELRRVAPVIRALRKKLEIPISIDTRRSEVAEAAIAVGAEIVNDVTALRTDGRIAQVVRRAGAGLILMHMRGEPKTMQRRGFARDVMADVKRGLRAAAEMARRAGVRKSQIVLDPGIGFGKNFSQNYELLARLPELERLGYALLVGTSRKTFIGHTLGGLPPEHREWGTAATVAASILGGAHIVRVHKVKEMRQVACVADEILRAEVRRR
jgi:dihydropteroate synthase